MTAYILRRLLYLPLIVFGVLLVTFTLFRVVGGDVSAQYAGKAASAETIAEIRAEMGFDKPLLVNLDAARQRGPLAVFDSQFFHHFTSALTLDFGRSYYTKQNVWDTIKQGAIPSLSITVPMFLGLLVTSLSISLVVAFFRGTLLDRGIVVLCVLGMSLPSLAVILYGQYLLAYQWELFPIFGYAPIWSTDDRTGQLGLRYIVLPVLLGIAMGLGSDVRFYRTVMLDEMHADYVRTAYAKGLSTPRVMLGHLLKNAMIPVISSVVLAIPFLFLGSLLLERFFGVPGLGFLMIEAINSRDFQVINALTFIISILFVVGNLLTDVCYALVDPRVSLR